MQGDCNARPAFTVQPGAPTEPLKPRQCLLVIASTFIYQQMALYTLWLDNVYLQLSRRPEEATVSFDIIKAGFSQRLWATNVTLQGDSVQTGGYDIYYSASAIVIGAPCLASLLPSSAVFAACECHNVTALEHNSAVCRTASDHPHVLSARCLWKTPCRHQDHFRSNLASRDDLCRQYSWRPVCRSCADGLWFDLYTSGVGATGYARNQSSLSLVNSKIARTFSGDGAASAGVDSFLRLENCSFTTLVRSSALR
jgi:hypothetical protein